MNSNSLCKFKVERTEPYGHFAVVSEFAFGDKKQADSLLKKLNDGIATIDLDSNTPLRQKFLQLQEKEVILNKIALHCEGKTTVLTVDLKRLGLQ